MRWLVLVLVIICFLCIVMGFLHFLGLCGLCHFSVLLGFVLVRWSLSLMKIQMKMFFLNINIRFSDPEAKVMTNG
jgi:hypothetical protein